MRDKQRAISAGRNKRIEAGEDAEQEERDGGIKTGSGEKVI